MDLSSLSHPMISDLSNIGNLLEEEFAMAQLVFPLNETKIDFRAVLLRVAQPFGSAIASKLNEFIRSFLSESQVESERQKQVTEDILVALETSMRSALPILLKDKQ